MELIEKLREFDNKEGYSLSYDGVKNKLQPIMQEIIQNGEKYLDELHNLLNNEETWSCLFALEILKEIKSEKSIPFLIEFIENNEEGDYFEGCEEAMKTLIATGIPSINPLLKEITKLFEDKIYLAFLVGALTAIKEDEVFDFMVKTTQDYFENQEKYKEWFRIEDFTYHFEVQGKKEILPTLIKIYSLDNLSEFEKRELKSTIEVVENPEEYYDKIKKGTWTFKDIFEKSSGKIGRNQPCPCGSGKKYKKCCLNKNLNF